ncbi:MAG TPA: hypothetical protein VFS21_25795 [Roseiflexaceae bacterium]|nr:hypothetical protein [Roseiflexaceae bacterium]
MTRQRKYGSKYRGSKHPAGHGGRGRGRSWRRKQGAAQIGVSMQHRSAQSVIEGGANNVMGEPPEGYGTVAPGIQNGGKRTA